MVFCVDGGPPAKERTIVSKKELFAIDNSKLFYHTREQISAGKDSFEVSDESVWPSTQISSNGEYLGQIHVSPDQNKVDPFIMNASELNVWTKTMMNYVSSMSDLTADVFDILTIEWLKHANHVHDTIEINVDDILRYRGITPRLNGNQRSSGYRPDQRESIAKQIQLLDHIWIEAEREIYSNGDSQKKTQKLKGRAIHLHLEFREQDEDGNTELLLIRARPGDMFAHTLLNGRQTALMSKKALEYDVDKFPYEKRLTRYLSYIWRIRQQNASYTDTIRVQTLLDAIKLPLNKKRPLRTWERLEKALERLEKDRVVKSFQFENADMNIIGRRGWSKKMLEWKVQIVPPDEISSHYIQITSPTSMPTQISGIAKKVKEKRESLALSLSQASEQIGVNVATLSRIENQKVSSIRGSTKKKIESWLQI